MSDLLHVVMFVIFAGRQWQNYRDPGFDVPPRWYWLGMAAIATSKLLLQ